MTDELRSQLLPVLDLKDGQVVRGVAGRRDEYLPIVSRWTTSSEPLQVARALRERFGFEQFYVADLGGICNQPPHEHEIATIVREGFALDVDAGVRSAADCYRILETPRTRAVIALETISAPHILLQLASQFPASRLIFSLDLKGGAPLAAPGWPNSALDIVSIAIESGVQKVIVLDLAAIGSDAGCPTLALCREIRTRWPGIEIITGGGIRDSNDVQRALDAGVDRVLVASALHDGRLS